MKKQIKSHMHLLSKKVQYSRYGNLEGSEIKRGRYFGLINNTVVNLVDLSTSSVKRIKRVEREP